MGTGGRALTPRLGMKTTGVSVMSIAQLAWKNGSSFPIT